MTCWKVTDISWRTDYVHSSLYVYHHLYVYQLYVCHRSRTKVNGSVPEETHTLLESPCLLTALASDLEMGR